MKALNLQKVGFESIMGTVIVPGQNNWDPFARQYKCCCNSCHVKTGAMVIGIIEAVSIGLNLISGIGRGIAAGAVPADERVGVDPGSTIGGAIFGAVLGAIVVGLLLWGLKKERAGFLLPHLILQGIGLVLLGILTVAVIVAGAVGSAFLVDAIANQSGQDIDRKTLEGAIVGIAIAIVVALVIAIAFEVWFFLVILHAYRFIKDKALYGGGMTAGYTATMPQGYPPTQMAYPPGYAQPPPAYPTKN